MCEWCSCLGAFRGCRCRFRQIAIATLLQRRVDSAVLFNFIMSRRAYAFIASRIAYSHWPCLPLAVRATNDNNNCYYFNANTIVVSTTTTAPRHCHRHHTVSQQHNRKSCPCKVAACLFEHMSIFWVFPGFSYFPSKNCGKFTIFSVHSTRSWKCYVCLIITPLDIHQKLSTSSLISIFECSNKLSIRSARTERRHKHCFCVVFFVLSFNVWLWSFFEFLFLFCCYFWFIFFSECEIITHSGQLAWMAHKTDG